MLRAPLSTDTSSSCTTKLQCSMIIKWKIVVLISTLNLIEIIRVMIFFLLFYSYGQLLLDGNDKVNLDDSVGIDSKATV